MRIRTGILLLLFFLVKNSYGFESVQTSINYALVGGGENYPHRIFPEDSDYLVHNKEELLFALNAANSQDIIYIADNAKIDLTDEWRLTIKEGVTLASGRGYKGSQGALLYTNRHKYPNDYSRKKDWLFQIVHPRPKKSENTKQTNDNTEQTRENITHSTKNITRITGLRFRGPFIEIDDEGCDGFNAVGIYVDTSQVVLIDNNELFAWPRVTIHIESSLNVTVSHNHIHHNRRQERDCEDPKKLDSQKSDNGDKSKKLKNYSLGYGVSADKSENVIIEHNLFNHNRHDITSRGSVRSACQPYPTEYEARFNLVMDGGTSASFDVHGGRDSSSRFDDNAGTRFLFHHNEFLQDEYSAILIRGVPRDYAKIYQNHFPRANQYKAICQKYGKSQNKKINCRKEFSQDYIEVSDNTYSVPKKSAWFVTLSDEPVYAYGEDPLFPDGEYPLFQFRHFSNVSLDDVAWGDFDGDRRADAIFGDGSSWYVSLAGKSDWQHWGTSNYTMAQLRLADLNGDGQTDIFRSTNNQWWVSYSGQEKWKKLLTDDSALHELYFGDFDHDGKDDVLKSNGAYWLIASAGNSEWTRLRASSYQISDLLFGDFDGDGKMDMLRADGTHWWLLRSGQGNWVKWSVSSNRVNALRVADIDGDGKSDIFKVNKGKWWVSFGGNQKWKVIRYSDIDSSDIVLQDVNGDGRTDILMER